MDEFYPGERAMLSHPNIHPDYNNRMVTILEEKDGDGIYVHTIDGYGDRQFHSWAYTLQKVVNEYDEKPISQDALMEVLNA